MSCAEKSAAVSLPSDGRLPPPVTKAEPCCLGCGIPTSDPGHQAVTWAAARADTDPSVSPFWRSAIVYDAYQRWRTDNPDAPSQVGPIVEREAAFASEFSSWLAPGRSLMIATPAAVPTLSANPFTPSAPLRVPVVTVTDDGGKYVTLVPPGGAYVNLSLVFTPVSNCCCIAKDILIAPQDQNPGQPTKEGGTGYESEVTVDAVLLSGTANNNPCTIEWSEITNVPWQGDWNPWEWKRFTHDNPDSKVAKQIKDAEDALAAVPCPGPHGKIVQVMDDFPKMVSNKTHPVRILIAKIVLKSGCDSTSVTKYWMQIITPGGVSTSVWNVDPMLLLRAIYDWLRKRGYIR